jgi:hypothetical protein
MDHDLELRFQSVKKELEKTLACGDMDVSSILFLIGVNELGMGYKDFSKSEKTDLMHIAICTLLEPHGFYRFVGKDADNWPHFELIDKLPPLDDRQQQHLLKDAIVSYFEVNGYVTIDSSSD